MLRGRFYPLGSGLIRNESSANLLTLSHVLTPTQLEGKALSSSYVTLSHDLLN